MSLGKKQFEKAYKRVNKKVIEEQLQEDYDSMYNDDFYDYWNECHCLDDKHPSLKDIAVGRLLTVLSKLRVRGSKAMLDHWYW
jgi:hypothetical protein